MLASSLCVVNCGVRQYAAKKASQTRSAANSATLLLLLLSGVMDHFGLLHGVSYCVTHAFGVHTAGRPMIEDVTGHDKI